MPIEDKTDYTRVISTIQTKVQNMERAVIRELGWIGEQCVSEAKNNLRGPFAYTDQTSNLRSSIGWAIAKNGEILKKSKFEPVKPSGRDGSKKGKEFVAEIASDYPGLLVLIIVAGMDYAVHVSNRGYDVLDTAELIAQKLFTKLKSKVVKRLNE